MALKIRSIEELGGQVSKVTVEGQPISAKRSISVKELWEFYRDREVREADDKIIEVEQVLEF